MTTRPRKPIDASKACIFIDRDLNFYLEWYNNKPLEHLGFAPWDLHQALVMVKQIQDRRPELAELYVTLHDYFNRVSMEQGPTVTASEVETIMDGLKLLERAIRTKLADVTSTDSRDAIHFEMLQQTRSLLVGLPERLAKVAEQHYTPNRERNEQQLGGATGTGGSGKGHVRPEPMNHKTGTMSDYAA